VQFDFQLGQTGRLSFVDRREKNSDNPASVTREPKLFRDFKASHKKARFFIGENLNIGKRSLLDLLTPDQFLVLDSLLYLVVIGIQLIVLFLKVNKFTFF